MRALVIVTLFLALTTVFALYTVNYTQGLPTTKSVTQVDSTYELRGNYGYTATLAPNVLYNSTSLESGNGSLFVSITKTIDVTYSWSLFTSKPGSAQLNYSYLALLSGGVWNTTLDAVTNRTQMSDAFSAFGSQSFVLNITEIHNTIHEVENQLQYVSPRYTIKVLPVLAGSLTVSGQVADLNFTAPLDLTMTNGLISVNGTSYGQNGTLTSVSKVGLPANVKLGTDSRYFLLGSLVAVGASGTATAYSGRRRRRSGAEALEVATRPYREIIAASKSPPEGGKQIAMESWEDLVKVADTLGKPILEFVGKKPEGGPEHLFYVSEEGTYYVYEFILEREPLEEVPAKVEGPKDAPSSSEKE